MKTNTFSIISHSVLLRMRNVSNEIRTENEDTHFMFNNIFSLKIMPYMRQRGKILYGRTGHRWKSGTCTFTLDALGYKHTFSICNIYCFSTTTMVARTLLSVMFNIHCLSCYCFNVMSLCKYQDCAFVMLPICWTDERTTKYMHYINPFPTNPLVVTITCSFFHSYSIP